MADYEGVHSADFVGDYERLLVYDKALTDEEITGLYQSGPSGIEEKQCEWYTHYHPIGNRSRH